VRVDATAGDSSLRASWDRGGFRTSTAHGAVRTTRLAVDPKKALANVPACAPMTISSASLGAGPLDDGAPGLARGHAGRHVAPGGSGLERRVAQAEPRVLDQPVAERVELRCHDRRVDGAPVGWKGLDDVQQLDLGVALPGQRQGVVDGGA
jgi:hypothetical protein